MSVKSINNAYLKAARVLASTKAYGPALQKWFGSFERAKVIFDEHGTLKGHITSSGLSSWLHNALKDWKNGNLLNEQIAALQSIGIQRTETIRFRPSKPGERLQRTLYLLDHFNRETSLPKKDMAELEDLLSSYRKKYEQGQLSETMAQKLGLA